MKNQKSVSASGWPRRAAALGVSMVVLIFLLPLLFLSEPSSATEQDRPQAVISPPPLLPPAPAVSSASAEWDQARVIRVLHRDGSVESLPLDAYLRGVVAAEMPASFHPEALKAQAVAARTYCLKSDEKKHPGADICTDPGCCQAYLTPEEAAANWGAQADFYGSRIAQAVAETGGLLCLFEGQPIDAVFFSSSGGRTADAQAVWGAQVPYLVPVDSPEGNEVPNRVSYVELSAGEFAHLILSTYPDADLSGPHGNWISDLVRDESGNTARVTIGGVTLTGPQLRSVLGLRSAHFTPSVTDAGFSFEVTGHGHGVGMSQYGANAMAAEGKSFRDILTWYYTGITVAQPDPGLFPPTSGISAAD